MNQKLSTLPATALPRTKAHVDSANFSPVRGAAAGLSLVEEVRRRVLAGERAKEIMADLGISQGYTHALMRDAGFELMRVTAEERDLILSGRAHAALFSVGPVAKMPVELKPQPQPARPGRRDIIKGERS